MDGIFQGQVLRPDFPFVAEIQTESCRLYHWHDEFEMLLVKEGTVLVIIPGKEYQLGADDLLLIDSGEVHCLMPGTDARWLSVRFAPRLMEPRLFDSGAGMQAKSPAVSMDVARCSCQWEKQSVLRFRQLVEKLADEAAAQSAGWQVAVRGGLFELALMMLRELPESGEELPRRDNRDTSLKKTLLFLAENYTRDISLKECADAMGFNMNYFSRFFRSHTGIHFHQYLTTLRLQKAQQLLLTTGLPITEVVSRSGFQNAKTFNRVFKNTCGCSPREFRRDGATSGQL